MIYKIGQIIGIIYLIFFIISFQFKDKKQLMMYRIISKIFASIHYLMIGATTGFISQFVGIFPNYFAYKYEKDTNKKRIFAILFCIAFLILSMVSYKNIYDLLPMVASIITIVALFLNGTKYIRALQFVISPMFLVYNIINVSYAGIVVEILVLISCVIGIFRLDKVNKKITEM